MSKVEQSRKTGGRAAGTPNKRTLDVQLLLEELGCCPIEGMAKIAMDENNSPELRGRMYCELAHYVAPKRAPTMHPSKLADSNRLSDPRLTSLDVDIYTLLNR
jgi:hypothetical protein